MCFSSTASFATAAATAAIGLLAMSRLTTLREAPLAATPIFFAFQQTLEGMLWLCPPAPLDGPLPPGLTLAYLIFAQAFWPLYAPVAVMLAEPSERRRTIMLPWLAVGLGVSAYLLWGLLTGPAAGRILDGHVVYETGHGRSMVAKLGYLAAATVPLMLSSHRWVVILGVLVLIGCVVAYFFYATAVLSVWCFFAAAASVVILGHFERARRGRLTPAAAMP